MSGCLCLLAAMAVLPAVEADIVFQRVTLYDGSLAAPVQGDVAVRGERIVGVGEFEVSGTPRLIDGSGLIAAPGFIDLHNHSDRPIVAEETRLNRNYLTQGVTTIVTGNCGGGELNVADYLERIDRNGAGTNVAHLIPHGTLRRRVMRNAKRQATPAELAEMVELVHSGMRAGAFGMSTGLIYVPSKYSDTRELIHLAGVVRQHGGIYVSHMRNEGTGLLEAIQETLTIGNEASTPVHISHLKASGRAAWGLAIEAVKLIQKAREQGRQVTADQYPYTASSTSLGAMVIPDEYRQRDRLQEGLDNTRQRERLLEEISRAIEARSGGASLLVASYRANPQWQGKDLATLGREEGRSVLDIVLEIQLHGGAQMVNFGMSEEEVRLIMQQTFVATASDGGSKLPDDTVPHPRNYGTFPRRIGEYSLRSGIVPLELSIHSASGLPAEILGLADRGYLREGYFADIVLFDPESFIDAATFRQPHQYAAGVRYLLVNGQLVIDEGHLEEKLSGRAVRRR